MERNIKPRDFLIFASLLVFPIVKMLCELILSIRQLLVIDKTLFVPMEFRRVIPIETFKVSRFYTLDRLQFRTVVALFELSYNISMFGKFSLYSYWESSMDFAEHFGFNRNNEIAVSLPFVFYINYMLALIDIPISYYETFVIETRYGFNKQTLMEFLKEHLILLVITQLVTLPMVACAIYVIRHGGTRYIYFLWLFISIGVVVFIYVQPLIITPLFYNVKPFPPGRVKQLFENLAISQFFPVTELYLVEGSRKSNHSNAYLTGIFGSARIVLYDTLLYRRDPVTGKELGMRDEEVFAVICHEMGHFRNRHMMMRVVIVLAEAFAICTCFALLISYDPLYEAIGFPPNVRPVFIGFLGVCLLIAPLTTLYDYITKCIYRYAEFEADQFAIDLGRGEYLKRALCILQKDNLSCPVNDWMFSRWFCSHPTLLERIKRIDTIRRSNRY